MSILEIGMEPEEIRDVLANALHWHLNAMFEEAEIYDGREIEDCCAEWLGQEVEFYSTGVLRGSEFFDLKEAAIMYLDQAIDDFANNGGNLDQLPAILTAYRRYCADCVDKGIKFVLALDPAESYLDAGFAVLRDGDGIEFARVPTASGAANSNMVEA